MPEISAHLEVWQVDQKFKGILSYTASFRPTGDHALENNNKQSIRSIENTDAELDTDYTITWDFIIYPEKCQFYFVCNGKKLVLFW